MARNSIERWSLVAITTQSQEDPPFLARQVTNWRKYSSGSIYRIRGIMLVLKETVFLRVYSFGVRVQPSVFFLSCFKYCMQ